jgi:hypothetical protein
MISPELRIHVLVKELLSGGVVTVPEAAALMGAVLTVLENDDAKEYFVHQYGTFARDGAESLTKPKTGVVI